MFIARVFIRYLFIYVYIYILILNHFENKNELRLKGIHFSEIKKNLIMTDNLELVEPETIYVHLIE